MDTNKLLSVNAAYAVGREAVAGRIEPGLKADLLLCAIPNYFFVAYEPGRNPIRHVIKNGRFVVRHGQRI